MYINNKLVEFCPTYKNRNADAFSRLPRTVVANEVTVPPDLDLLMEAMNDLTITCENIKNWTRKDHVLSRVYFQHGWPENIPLELKSFSTCKSKLSSLIAWFQSGDTPSGKTQDISSIRC